MSYFGNRCCFSFCISYLPTSTANTKRPMPTKRKTIATLELPKAKNKPDIMKQATIPPMPI